MPSSDRCCNRSTDESNPGQTWDKRILGAIFLVSIVTFVVAGLDFTYDMNNYSLDRIWIRRYGR